ncbi:hypothetical protein BDF22DRAFT_667088 [Syncephalis plumigaleata]|nr:hypothetical protein BDF22DRAFT_667088 [Syncephalis plumigaleata]
MVLIFPWITVTLLTWLVFIKTVKGERNLLTVDVEGYRAVCSFSYVKYVSYNLTVLKDDKISSVFVTPMSDWNRIKSYQNANRTANRVRKRVDINSSCIFTKENSISRCIIGEKKAHHLGGGQSGFCIVVANAKGNHSVSVHLDYVFSNSEASTYANTPDATGVARAANANSSSQGKHSSNSASRRSGSPQYTARYMEVILCLLSLVLVAML